MQTSQLNPQYGSLYTLIKLYINVNISIYVHFYLEPKLESLQSGMRRITELGGLASSGLRWAGQAAHGVKLSRACARLDT